MTFIDYYNILEVPPTAQADEIKTAVKAQRREWNKRQGHPSVDIRSRAEKMTQYLSEAEKVLLDPSQRADFDRQLAANAAKPEASTAGIRDWVASAREYLDSNSAVQANAAAREATTNEPNNPEAWYVRACASEALSDYGDATFAISEALRLTPSNAVFHCELGDIYAVSDQWPAAKSAYERASALEPENPFYIAGVASALIALDQSVAALPMLKKVAAEYAAVDLFQEKYAIALLDSSVEQWSTFPDGSTSMLTAAQVELTQKALEVVSGLRINDPDLRAHQGEITRQVDNAAREQWHGSDNLLGYVMGLGLSFIIAVISISMGGGGVAVGLIFLAGTGLIVYLFVKRHRMAGWQWSARHAPVRVRASGVQ
ncbi:hypothetical protein E3O06_11485 [Cryobacterium glaciale]|uniref:J domain-containing protein n=1 Tax=Cryobacterium glaciale TaxID=1259145 RepID=A0A4R8UVU1_9MICO|nr:DnaJ domain-containing protein [Cryobacterium glaciale]TFB71876.1 hypothetical protein E3O06_11485 [Cryobacterium glaciale]